MDDTQKANLLTWIEALESGEYEQGRYLLTTVMPDGTAKHCCWGVACDLFKDSLDLSVEDNDVDDDEDYEGIARFYGGCKADPPVKMLYKVGLPYVRFEKDGPFSTFGLDREDWIISDALMYLNDQVGLSFVEIAALLREEFNLSKSNDARPN